jgi:hypothetical protein
MIIYFIVVLINMISNIISYTTIIIIRRIVYLFLGFLICLFSNVIINSFFYIRLILFTIANIYIFFVA